MPPRFGPALRLVAGAAVLAGAAALALPASAVAHGGGATVALDYRLQLDLVSRSLPGVQVRVLDGDRALEARVDDGVVLLVRGSLREPMFRIGDNGVWVNAGSPTATADGLVSKERSGWVRVGDGRSLAWHDHRLAPPPSARPGPAGRFSIPVEVDGRAATIGGTFIRVARPSLWPWLGGAIALTAVIWAVSRRRPWRGALTVALGVTGGLAALVAATTFAMRAAPTGGVAWLQLVSGIAVAVALGGLLAFMRGQRRVHAAGVVGGVAAAVTLSSLPVFWHGVVVSALPETPARLACALALVCGLAAAALSFLPDFDEAPRSRQAMILLAAALALGGDPSVVPLPIGPGPRYRPPAVARAGRPVGALTCGRSGKTFRVHVELFAHRRVVIVPAGIGVARGGCVYPARTLTPTGIVEVARGSTLRLGDLFRIWGRRLGPRALLSFHSVSPVRAYVGGKRFDGPPAAVPLTPGAQIVVELGAYVPPHPTFLFPRRAQ